MNAPVEGPGVKCLDVDQNIAHSGQSVQLWECNAATGQRWSFMKDNTVRASGKCLDAPQGNTHNGTRLQIYDCNGLWTQKWKKK